MRRIILAAILAFPLSGIGGMMVIQTAPGPILTTTNTLTDATFDWEFGIYTGSDASSVDSISPDFTVLASATSTGTDIAAGLLAVMDPFSFAGDSFTPSLLIKSADDSEFALLTSTQDVPAIGVGGFVINPGAAPVTLGAGTYLPSGALQLIPEPSAVLFAALAGFFCFFRRVRK